MSELKNRARLEAEAVHYMESETGIPYSVWSRCLTDEEMMMLYFDQVKVE